MSRNVSLNYLDNYNANEVEKVVQKMFADFNMQNVIKPKMKVLLKVCLPSDNDVDKAETTHPSVVRAVVNEVTKLGADCIVADCPYKKHSLSRLERVYLITGMIEVANTSKCELNQDLNSVKIEVPNGVKCKSANVLKVIKDADLIINVGKVKFNKKLGYLGACANLFGIVPGEIKTQILNRLNTYKDFSNYLIDLYLAVKDKLALNILDGVVTLEAGESPRMLSCLGASDDIFSLDASIFDILKIDYSKTLLVEAEKRNLFDKEKAYKLIRDKIEKFQLEDFELMEFNDETKLHKNKITQKVYNTLNQQRVVINKSQCKGCGICSKICPVNAIMMKYDKDGELFAEIDYSKCIFCYKCFTACPYKIVDYKTPIGYKKLKKEIDKTKN